MCVCVCLCVYSLQRVVPGLRGDGVLDRGPGSAESHKYDPELQPPPDVHGGPLQGVLAGNHAHGQPEEVRRHANTPFIGRDVSDAPLTTDLCLHRLFFRRHYNINTVIFCALDPQDRK